MTITCRKCTHVLKISVVYHFLLKKISIDISKKNLYIIGVIAWLFCQLKDKMDFNDPELHADLFGILHY